MNHERKLKSGSVGSVGSAPLLPTIRDLYWKLPESYVLEPWELVHVLYPLITQMTWPTKRRSLRLSRWRDGTGRNGGQHELSTWMESLFGPVLTGYSGIDECSFETRHNG
jgi:hypothetical protein